jgi:hypothetical protein
MACSDIVNTAQLLGISDSEHGSTFSADYLAADLVNWIFEEGLGIL